MTAVQSAVGHCCFFFFCGFPHAVPLHTRYTDGLPLQLSCYLKRSVASHVYEQGLTTRLPDCFFNIVRTPPTLKPQGDVFW